MATDNPLSAFFRGFTNAQQAGRQAQQQAAANELNEQLKQLQIASAQQQLIEASKTPQQRFAERAQEAMFMDALKRGALVQQPAGLGTVVEPGFIPFTAEQALAEELASQIPADNAATTLSNAVSQQFAPLGESAGIPVGLEGALASIIGAENVSPNLFPSQATPPLTRSTFIPPRAPFTVQRPIGDTGYAFSPAAEAASTPLDPDIRSVGGNLVRINSSGKPEVVFSSTQRTSGLTPNRQSEILAKAGASGMTQEDIDNKYTVDGAVDFNRLILDSNRLISQDKKLAAEEKLKQIPATDRSKATGFIAAYDDLNKLITLVKEFQVQGKDLGAWSRAVGVALEEPPDGVLSALSKGILGQSLTADDRQLNALKARVRSAVTKANAGLSQTQKEIANVTQYTPATNDTLDQTLQKAAGLQDYLTSQVKAITTDPRDWLKSLEEAPVVDVPRGTTAPTAGSTKIGRFELLPPE